MQILPKTPDRKWGDTCSKKNHPCKKERFALTSVGPFRLKGLSSTWLLAK